MPFNSKINTSESLSAPLTPKSKQDIYEQLQKSTSETVKSALIDAALKLHQFPNPLTDKVSALQKAYQAHKNNRYVEPHLKQAIITYIDTEGFAQFQNLIKKPMIEEHWNSGLLFFLAKHLNFKLDEDPLIEAIVKDGKVYWRVVKGNQVVYSRQNNNQQYFDADKKDSWRMSWEQFRLFKDSGKRSGTVEITKERFMAHLSHYHQQNVDNLWGQLKQQGILNHRNRLSEGWRITSNEYVHLQTNIKYEKIINTLDVITTNKNYQESLAAIPNTFIFRRERSKKVWYSTGLIKNDVPRTPDYCTQLWDVGGYVDLNNHRNTQNEEQLNHGNKLNYDHIPSRDSLETNARTLHAQYMQTKISYEKELQKNDQAIDARLSELQREQNFHYFTRQQSDEKIQALKKKESNYQNFCNYYNYMANNEIQNYNTYAWAIAIPEKLHKQGETFLQSSKDQQKSTENPFLKDVRTYLDILENRGEEFSLTIDDYLKALGAFRYLYHCQVKEPQLISGKYKTTFTSHSFFQNLAEKNQIDNLFNDRIQHLIEKKEGIVFTNENKSDSHIKK